MTESTITAKGQTTVPAEIRQVIGGVLGTRLVWHALQDGRLFVRVKNKSFFDLKGLLTPPKGKRVAIKDMRPCWLLRRFVLMCWCVCSFGTTSNKR